MRTTSKRAVILFSFLAMSVIVRSQDYSKIVSSFTSQSIPVQQVAIKDQSVVIEMNYQNPPGSTENTTQSDVLAIFCHIAETFPQMETILVHAREAGEPLFDASINMKAAVEYAQGRLSSEEILTQMSIKEHISLEDILSSLIPEEPDPEKPVKIINPILKGRGDSTPGIAKPEKDDAGSHIRKTRSGDAGQSNFLGAYFVGSSGEGIMLAGIIENSPADHAGLRKDDTILAVEDTSLQDIGNDPGQFTKMIGQLPADRPLRFHVQRGEKKFDVWIKLEKIDRTTLQDLEQRPRQQLRSDFEQGRELMLNKNYSDAIPHFKRSLKSQPHDSHQALGICYYHTGRFKEAEKQIEEAYKRNKKVPLNAFYLAASLDQRDKITQAIHFYKKYLKLNHNNKEMVGYAQHRLKALGNKRGRPNKDALIQIIDAILKEIER